MDGWMDGSMDRSIDRYEMRAHKGLTCGVPLDVNLEFLRVQLCAQEVGDPGLQRRRVRRRGMASSKPPKSNYPAIAKRSQSRLHGRAAARVGHRLLVRKELPPGRRLGVPDLLPFTAGADAPPLWA